MIFQEPMTALNPVMRIGDQIDEVIRFHVKKTKQERQQLALSLLEDVQLPDPPRILKAYPHELSGGQRQRAMIAMALALEPKILIADEPTTALDVTTQAQILILIKELQAKHNTGVLFITHDFGVVADIADRVAVMQHGKIVEIGPADSVLNHPTHPYTQALTRAVPSLIPRSMKPVEDNPILEVKSIVKTYRSGGGWFGMGSPEKEVHACDHVTVSLNEGETLGIVGESGSGKSTLARCIVRLLNTDSGEIVYRGQDLCKLDRAGMRPYRSRVQMVFQDPYASLNPRATVGRIVTEGPIILGEDKSDAEPLPARFASPELYNPKPQPRRPRLDPKPHRTLPAVLAELKA
jgi:peptide/nickel transport system ATP-binding protein